MFYFLMYSFLLSFLENHRRVHSKYVDLPPGLRSSDPTPIKGSKPAEFTPFEYFLRLHRLWKLESTDK